MSPEEAVEVLNTYAHRGRTDWVVRGSAEGVLVEIQVQSEDYPYRLTAFEAIAIALQYLTSEE